MDDSKWVSTAIKIDRELLDRLKQAADERCLGRNLMINMAVTRFLDSLIPIDQLTKKEGNNEQAEEVPARGAFDRYIDGATGMHRAATSPTPTAADPGLR